MAKGYRTNGPRQLPGVPFAWYDRFMVRLGHVVVRWAEHTRVSKDEHYDSVCTLWPYVFLGQMRHANGATNQNIGACLVGWNAKFSRAPNHVQQSLIFS